MQQKQGIISLIAFIGLLVLFSCWIVSSGGLLIKDNFSQQFSINIVVARFNESLDWLCSDEFVDKMSTKGIHTTIYIYNKGIDTCPRLHHTRACLNKKLGCRVIVIPLKNVGRECNTYLTHIINHYHNHADVTVFLHGSSDMIEKKSRALAVITKAYKDLDSAFICDVRSDDIMSVFRDFAMDSYASTYADNYRMNPESSVQLAHVRPFANWFTHHFGKIDVNCAGYKGIFAVSKQKILSRPKSFYEQFQNQFSDHSNTEACHYLERAWLALFHPIDAHRLIDVNAL